MINDCVCGGYLTIHQVSSVSFQATCGKCAVSGEIRGSVKEAELSQKFRKDLHAPMTSKELIDAMKNPIVKAMSDMRMSGLADATGYALKPLSHPGGLNWKPQMKVNDAFKTEDGNTWVITDIGPVMMGEPEFMGEPGSEFIMPQWPQQAIDNDKSKPRIYSEFMKDLEKI